MGASSHLFPAVERLEGRSLLSGAILHVGPTQPYKLPSAAIAAAHDGDTILIDAAGNYTNDVANITKNNLTIAGVGSGRAVIKTDGRVYGNKGIWVFAQGYSNLTVKNIDFEGARVADSLGGNGAGIRAQGTNLTVLNCRFYNNQNGILGGSGSVNIQSCEFDHNGLSGLTHNVYISDTAATLVFAYNYSHDSQVGHLLKSRAAVNYILYNRLSDNTGGGSYEIDLPNGGRADVVGNVIQQSANSQNGTVLAYGEEGLVNAKNELNVTSNTFVNNRSAGTFISAQHLPATGFRMVAKNNLFAGPGTPISVNTGTPVTGGNVVTTVAGAGFVDAVHYNYHLLKGSPAINVGTSAGTDSAGFSLTPVYDFVFPNSGEKRAVNGLLDAGAYEFV